MYKYSYNFFCLYWFLNSIVFVSVCLRDGLFAWTSTHWISYCMLSASGAGILKWPASGNEICGLFLLQACGQRNEQGWWKTPLCTFVQRQYFGTSSQSSFHLVHLYLHPQHVCRKLIQLTWQTLNTAVDGNTNPPLCLKAVNLAHKGSADICEAWASVGSSSSSPLHVSQETFARSDRTMYPAM